MTESPYIRAWSGPNEITHQQLLNVAKLTPEDIKVIYQCRRDYNRLGFAYQLAFVKLAARFPAQQPFELDDELLTYVVSAQLNIPVSAIQTYLKRQPTLSEHQRKALTNLTIHHPSPKTVNQHRDDALRNLKMVNH